MVMEGMALESTIEVNETELSETGGRRACVTATTRATVLRPRSSPRGQDVCVLRRRHVPGAAASHRVRASQWHPSRSTTDAGTVAAQHCCRLAGKDHTHTRCLAGSYYSTFVSVLSNYRLTMIKRFVS